MKLPRFTLRELFLLVVIAAMGCGWWVNRGSRSEPRNGLSPDFRRVQVYYVEDLVVGVGGIADFDSLIRDIETNVDPGSWESAGGKGSIAGYPTNLSLVIQHDEESQQKVRAFLDTVRANKHKP